jgi:hypothetical protein
MAFILLVGTEFAALRSVSRLANAVSFNLPVAILIFASFAARFGRARSRDWWFGFALFGWAQFVLGLLLPLMGARDLEGIPTNRLTLELTNWMIPTVLPAAANDPELKSRFDGLREMDLTGYRGILTYSYYRANAAVSLVVAAAGGTLAIALTACRRRPALQRQANRLS